MQTVQAYVEGAVSNTKATLAHRRLAEAMLAS